MPNEWDGKSATLIKTWNSVIYIYIYIYIERERERERERDAKKELSERETKNHIIGGLLIRV